jgi:putative ABC transport system substrate-binding protein
MLAMVRSRRAWVYVLSIAALVVPAGGIAYLGAVSYRDERGAVSAQNERQRQAALGIASRISRAVDDAPRYVHNCPAAVPSCWGQVMLDIIVEQLGRRAFIAALGGAAAWPRVARAQRPEQMRRIGVLQQGNESDPVSQLRRSAFVDGLRKFGWTEGTNVLIDYRWVGDDADRIRLYATELTGMRPDVIWASGSLPLLLLKRATRTIPVVFTQVYDPVGSGFVTNLTRPGGNITGFTLGEFSMGGKTLEVLKEVAPQVSRVAVILNLAQPPHVAMWGSIAAIAPSFGVRLTPADSPGPEEIEHAIEAFAREPNGGLIVLPSPVTIVHRELITALAARHRLPAGRRGRNGHAHQRSFRLCLPERVLLRRHHRWS